MDEQIPGLENKSKIGIKFLPFEKMQNWVKMILSQLILK